jgi:glycosyltransferase Alg8
MGALEPAVTQQADVPAWSNVRVPRTNDSLGRRFSGWLIYFWLLAYLAEKVPGSALETGNLQWLVILGGIGMWRYSVGLVHFVRSQVFMRIVFPRHRRAARKLGAAGLPSHAYFLVTSFRIESATTAAVYRAAIREASGCGVP